jgi:hypothetical protein
VLRIGVGAGRCESKACRRRDAAPGCMAVTGTHQQLYASVLAMGWTRRSRTTRQTCGLCYVKLHSGLESRSSLPFSFPSSITCACMVISLGCASYAQSDAALQYCSAATTGRWDKRPCLTYPRTPPPPSRRHPVFLGGGAPAATAPAHGLLGSLFALGAATPLLEGFHIGLGLPMPAGDLGAQMHSLGVVGDKKPPGIRKA